jgi:tetratricopeptide (TPR) repeat protein
MRIRLTIAIAVALTSSCVRERRIAGTPVVAPAPTVWDRQIRNATDAGDGDNALKALGQRVAAEPDNIPVRLELARLYRDRGYPEVALEICRLAVARFPESGEAQLALVRALYETKRPQEGIAILEAHPRESRDYYSWLGILRDQTGAWETAEPAHRQAVAIAPTDDGLHNNLGYNLLMQKKSEEAAAEFREALRLNPASRLARNNLGMALASSNTAQAISNWETASDPATAHSNLAALWIEKGNYDEARKELVIALGYNKTHPAALRNMELVSRLDGKSATLSAKAAENRWDRWKSGFKRLFVGPLDVSK